MEQERITKNELYRIMKLTTAYWIKYLFMTPGDIDTLVQCLQEKIDMAYNLFKDRENFVTKEEFNIILSSAKLVWNRILPKYSVNRPLIFGVLDMAMKEVFAESDLMKDSKKAQVTSSVSSPKVSSPNTPISVSQVPVTPVK
jgi:hypothetical protein